MSRSAGIWGAVALMRCVAFGAESHQMGKQLYASYCSACHGENGKGDGVVSQFMHPKPADLTQLAKRAGGKFQFYDVVRTIDGRETLRAHGDPDMPVWGEVFVAEDGDRRPIDRRSRVVGLC